MKKKLNSCVHEEYERLKSLFALTLLDDTKKTLIDELLQQMAFMKMELVIVQEQIDPSDILEVTTWSRHKKLKSAYNHILFALKNNQLFHYLNDTVPNTSNEVEGGINARLKELIRSHRGTTITRKRLIVEWYLVSKSEGGIESFIRRYF
jgi:hypothetical protein